MACVSPLLMHDISIVKVVHNLEVTQICENDQLTNIHPTMTP